MSPTATRERRPATRAGTAPIDPRLADRRRAVTRRGPRRRRVLVAAAAVVSLLAAGAWPLLHSRVFSAAVVRVTGNVRTPTATVLSASGLGTHPPMIDVHAGALVAALDALPWVRTATVTLHWPDGVDVAIVERRAAAAVADRSAWAELDATGRVLATTPTAPAGLVTLTSVGTPGAPGTTLRSARRALAVAAALPPAFKALVQAVAPAPGGGVDLALAGGLGVVFGPPVALPAKFEDIASLLAGAHLAPGSVIDVTVPASPAVTPPPAGSNAG